MNRNNLGRKIFFVLSVITLLLVAVAAAKDNNDRQYVAIQDQYKKDYPSSSFESKVQQLFPAFAVAKRGDTFRVERCLSCHVPDISAIGPQAAADRLAQDFFKYEPNAAQIAKANGLQSTTTHSAHPDVVRQSLYDAYGQNSYAKNGQFQPYTVPGDNGQLTTVKLPGPIPQFLSPAANSGKPLGIDSTGCIVCHNGQRLSLDEVDAHKNLIINPEYSFTQGAALYYQYCASCHGLQGEGKIGPPLSNQDRLGFFNEDYYYRCIEWGMTDFEHYSSVMPNWGSISPDFHYDPSRDKTTPNATRVLTEDQIHILVQFIRHWENYDTLP